MSTQKAIEYLEKALYELKDLSEPELSGGSRVEKVGRIAHLHLAVIEKQGAITVEESRVIRRDLAGSKQKMRATANLFGTKGSGAILYRDVPAGTPVAGDQPVKLTEEGVRLAKEWRKSHGTS